MKLSQLIETVGDESVGFQNLDDCAISLDWSAKKGTRITFGTDQTISPGVGTDKLCLILWIDREDARQALSTIRAGGGK